jgi:long-chain fatty acid transport protein
MRTGLLRRAGAATVTGVVVGCWCSAAGATGIVEFPDNGSEQGGRGGAWIARASDPLASFYNPAGLAGQPTRLILQSNVNFQSTCFRRLKATNDPNNDGTQPGQYYPQVCSSDGAALDPQLAMTFHVTDRIGIGFAPILAPSAGASHVSFPEFLPSTDGGRSYPAGPSRDLETAANLLVLNPTIGIGVEVVNRLRLGASFQWGIASLSQTNAVDTGANLGGSQSPINDVKVVANATDYFFPGFTLGAIYSPTDDFDVAAWYKWSDSIKATGDIQTTMSYYTAAVATGRSSGGPFGNSAEANCGFTGATGAAATLCGNGNNLHITEAIPMEAKVGFRYHRRRSELPFDEHVRDPMAQDVFDVEVDLTWANDSAASNLQVRLPGDAGGIGLIPIPGTPGGANAPPNADVPHGFKDVYGIRLGGDYNVIPDNLALRAGAFFQSNGQNPQYQNIDFPGSSNGGFAFGATGRIHLSHEKARAIEVSLGYEHVFYATETNDGPNGVYGLAGNDCPLTAPPLNATTCTGGAQKYRTAWPVNLGTITNSINVLNVGLGYRF